MIGGIVTETVALPDKVWVDCEEQNSTSKCAIYVERNPKSLSISPGDTVWWQGGQAMWTPYCNRGMKDAKCGKHYDIKLNRIGCSGVKRPPT